MRGGRAHGDDRPRGHVEQDPVTDGEDDERIARQGLTDELSNVDDRAEPRVFGADEVGLLLQVEHGGVRDRGLVELFHQSFYATQCQNTIRCIQNKDVPAG